MTTTPEVKFCVRYLLEHGITALDYDSVAASLSISDPAFELVKVQKKSFYGELADKLRELWPAGDKMIDGKGYAWRDSTKNIAKRLQNLWEDRLKGKTFTIEECLTVARRYLAQYENNTKYMKTLKKFIVNQKQILKTNGEIHYVFESKFADMLEGIEAEDAVQNEWNDIINSATIGEGEIV